MNNSNTTGTSARRPGTASVGDKLVVPACDVGEVVAIETLTIEGHQADFYRIRLPNGRTWVPLGTLLDHGIRQVMSRDTALETLEILGAQEAPTKRANWNQRQKRYRETLLANTPTGLAEMAGELAAVRRTKGRLSFSEKKLFHQVWDLLASELALALGLAPDAAQTRMESALAV